MKADDIIEQFLDELNFDIDFDAKTKEFEIKTEDYHGEEFYLPTVKQVLNKNTQELLQAIIVDINPYFEIDIEDVTEFTDSETYNIEIHLKGINTYVDVLFELIKTGSLETTKDVAVKFEELLREQQFSFVHGRSITKKVNSLDDITSVVAQFETFFREFKKITSFNDLNESSSIITKFLNFK